MKESGLERLLVYVYAKNFICHIMTGKTVSRAIRALFLVKYALTTSLLDTMQENFEFSTFERIYHDLLNGKITLEEVNESAAVTFLQDILENYKTKFQVSQGL